MTVVPHDEHMADRMAIGFAPPHHRHHRRVESEKVQHAPKPRLALRGAQQSRRNRITRDTQISLLSHLREGADVDHLDPLADLRHYVGEIENGATNSNRPNDELAWDVRDVPVSELTLPKHHEHSGNGRFEWIGQENHFPANHLWDSKTGKTVFATPNVLREGYIAVSWTWGRFQAKNGFQKQFLKVGGTDWRVPSLPKGTSGHELLDDLKACLRKVPNYRYFWVDVLCIDQGFGSGRERQAEIEKQAKIFADAAGVLCYLWQEEQSDGLSRSVDGLGELLRWALVFKDDEQHSAMFDSVPDLSSYHQLFDRLRSNDWFTSLWTLQEIVLAPAGVWMTRYGHVCYLNDQPVTTRAVAMIIRLLSWASKRRERLWYEARRDYIVHTRRSEKEIKVIEDNHRKRKERMPVVSLLDPMALRQRLRGRVRTTSELKEPRPQSVPSSPPATARTESGFPTLSHESSATSYDQKLPWVIKRHEAEKVLRDEIRAWTDWSFSVACVDISLTATRAGIIVAGSHRQYNNDDAREAALLAALKVQPDKRFFLKRTPSNFKGPSQRGHLSPLLMNMLLLAEQRCHVFNVTHAVSRWSINRYLLDETEGLANDFKADSHAINDMLDSSTLSSSMLDQTSHEFQDGSALTDMLPDSASGIHSQVLHFTSRKKFDWSLTKGWHMHDGGALHIPGGVPIQRIVKHEHRNRRGPQEYAVWLRPNGCSNAEHVLRSHRDLRKFCNHHKWLLRLLGRKASTSFKHPRFIFLPLGTRMTTLASIDSAVEKSVSWFQPNTRESIGVVLVSAAADDDSKSRSVWHKFGDYHAKGLKSIPLRSQSGIFVTAYRDRDTVDDQAVLDCNDILQDVEFALNVVRRQPTLMSDWDMVKPEDYMLDSDDEQYVSGEQSESEEDLEDSEPRSPAVRTIEEYHFRELARGIRSAMRFQSLQPGNDNDSLRS